MKELFKKLTDCLLVLAFAAVMTVLGFIVGVTEGIDAEKDRTYREIGGIIENASFGTIDIEDRYEDTYQVWFTYQGEDYRLVFPKIFKN